MTVEATIERELKLGVWPGFELPDLHGIFNGATPSAPTQYRLEAVYFDTADLRLLRRGVTLRFRRGEEPGDVWTAKLPEETPALGMSRCEVTVPGSANHVPPMLEDVVRGWALGAALVPVARLRTLRHRTTLVRVDGRPMAVVDDDEVSILQRSRVAARFRELELELIDSASPKLLKRMAARMRSAGAQPVDQMPKLVRALGPLALSPWDLAQPSLAAQPTAADLIRGRLIGSAASLVDHLAAVVLDEDREGIHQARVAIRRLRTDLKTARPLLHSAGVQPLRRELDWLMAELGEVRDLDVMLLRLHSDVRALDRRDRGGAQAVLDQAMKDRATAYERLRGELRTPRCAALLEETARVAASPPFKHTAARVPASKALPGLVRKPLRDLRREVGHGGTTPDEEALHRVRISVKRARYAAELAAPAVGKKARRAARKLGKLQDVLGEHNDARTAEARLRGLGERTGATGAWAAGLLGGLQLAAAAESRERFEPAWAKAAANKRWRWTK